MKSVTVLKPELTPAPDNVIHELNLAFIAAGTGKLDHLVLSYERDTDSGPQKGSVLYSRSGNADRVHAAASVLQRDAIETIVDNS